VSNPVTYFPVVCSILHYQNLQDHISDNSSSEYLSSGKTILKNYFLKNFILHCFLILILLSANACAADADLTDYRCMDFALSYPMQWHISIPESCSNAAGNLSLEGSEDGSGLQSGQSFAIYWMRDPGIEPEEILDQMQENYNREGVSITSSERKMIKVADQAAEILTLTYGFKDSRQKKMFAAWNSTLSDRMFIATLSGRQGSGSDGSGSAGSSDFDNDSSDDSSEDSILFQRIISSFVDLGRHDKVKLSEKPSAGPWPIVLDDLLSSYHYLDPISLPARQLHMQVSHEVSWGNGSYSLNSHDFVWSDPPKTAIYRAGAVLHVLQQAGYEAKMVQNSGEIALAVRDPEGKWTKVSLNPESPARMVGVLSNDTGEVAACSDWGELAAENGIKSGAMIGTGSDDDGNAGLQTGLENIIRKDCEPSRYVELAAPKDADRSADRTWLKNLKDELKRFEYGRYYEKDVFDCSSTAQICWSALTKSGYAARLMLSYKGHPLEEHMWVVVEAPNEKGRYVAIETANVDENKRLVNLGRVVSDEAYFRGIMYNTSEQFSRLHPEEGI